MFGRTKDLFESSAMKTNEATCMMLVQFVSLHKQSA